MGFLNLAREEADELAKKSERSLVLTLFIFVFFCLLLSGGSRLIGSAAEEYALPDSRMASEETAISSAPVPQAEYSISHKREHAARRYEADSAPASPVMPSREQRDANGNVLSEKTYMRAVYQAFVLGDGFV